MKAGWEEKSVGDILQLEYGKPLDASDRIPDGRYPVYGANGQIGRTDKFYYDKPSIIVGRKGSAGEINLSEEKFWPLDVTYFVTFDEQRYDLRFVFYLLTTLELPKLAKGVKPGINRNEVYSQVTKAPPLTEQHRIVAILDEAFDGIATAKANAEKNLQNARALFESHLQSVFTERGEGWVETTLGEATGGVFTGPFGSLLHKRDYVEDEIPLVNPAHITDVGIEPDWRKTVSADTAQRLSSYIMREGDIVIGRRGEMGRCALVTDVENGWLCGTGSFLIKPSSRCNARYLTRFLRSDGCKQRLEKIAGGAVMPNLSNTDLGNLAFNLPPLERQKTIVDEIDVLAAETQRLESLYQQKLAALEDLKKSLLHQAFSGAL
jgi:type I restriction enzyme S subunit